MKRNLRLSAVHRDCPRDLDRKPACFPFHRLCLRIVCVQPTIPKLGRSHHFLWAPNVLYQRSCLHFVPLFRDSHFCYCVIGSFHNGFLLSLNARAFEKARCLPTTKYTFYVAIVLSSLISGCTVDYIKVEFRLTLVN